jgi:hypothetical protein
MQIYRLQRRGISLDVQRDLMQPNKPLLQAWLAFLTQQAMGQPTYVHTDPHDGDAFIQMRYRPHQAAADIAFLAPTLEENGRAVRSWSRLLDGACIEAAGKGIQRVFANLPASGAEVDTFHQSGFTLYASEDIYCKPAHKQAETTKPLPHLRPQQAEDLPAIQRLCVAITPQRVRQAEGGVSLTPGWEQDCDRYVVPGDGNNDLVAALALCTGAQVHWLRLTLHPDARHLAEPLVGWGLAELHSRSPRTVFCNIRQYESGVHQALEAIEFEPFASRSLMVKHTVAWIKAPVQEAVAAIKSSAEPVPPAYRLNGEPELAGPDSRLAAETSND